MNFNYDNFGPAFTALQQPSSTPLAQPALASSSMFNGDIPAWQSAAFPSDPTPTFHAVTQFPMTTYGSRQAVITPVVGRLLDVRI